MIGGLVNSAHVRLILFASSVAALTLAGPTFAADGHAPALELVQRMRAINRWREQYNPLRGLTLQRARAWLVVIMASLLLSAPGMSGR